MNPPGEGGSRSNEHGRAQTKSWTALCVGIAGGVPGSALGRQSPAPGAGTLQRGSLLSSLSAALGQSVREAGTAAPVGVSEPNRSSQGNAISPILGVLRAHELDGPAAIPPEVAKRIGERRWGAAKADSETVEIKYPGPRNPTEMLSPHSPRPSQRAPERRPNLGGEHGDDQRHGERRHAQRQRRQ